MVLEINSNPFLSILEKNYPNLYKSIFYNNNNKFIILIPNSQILINTQINDIFIKSHILMETNIEKNYINKCGQIIEMLNDTFITSFGFNNYNICNIIQKYKFNNSIQCNFIPNTISISYVGSSSLVSS
ncbi:uncharacterized protein TA08825 [Theileria annulata]|uniref:Uncharacterized protein n=1 Tax=Theileria annulata TaxID=5874 RepID=Q4UAI6_THEAN|nr:uncharacterized protein TA08825 [Theileria annulata]CAI76165.1 hypothetical protein, conserved [Theileria annulata]|eukprot:XP_952791.1 hypothetical protein, conserved [Theileria annulata]